MTIDYLDEPDYTLDQYIRQYLKEKGAKI